MADQEAIDNLLDELLQLKHDKLIMSGQLEEVLKHSAECIALATELNAKLKAIEATAVFTLVAGDDGERRFANTILELVQYAAD